MSTTTPKPKNWLRTLGALAGIVVSTASSAATVTTNELTLDTIFSQAIFGTNKIDIRFGAQGTFVAPSVLNNNGQIVVTSSPALDTLLGLNFSQFPTVNLFFIDSLEFCAGGNSPGLVGCGDLPGNHIVVESGFASGVNGGELIAHELGHNLGLDHVADGANLMNETVDSDFTLTAAQVTSILASPLIQLDGNQKFIQITPILVTVSAVPLPAGLPLALSGLAMLGMRVGRRSGSPTAV